MNDAIGILIVGAILVLTNVAVWLPIILGAYDTPEES